MWQKLISCTCTFFSLLMYLCKRNGWFPAKDMQTPPYQGVGIFHIHMKDAHCVETNEKSIFRFLFFSMVDCMYNLQVTHPIFHVCHRPKKILQKWPKFHGRCAMCWNESEINFSDFQFFRYSRFCTEIQKKKIMSRGSTPLTLSFWWGAWPPTLPAGGSPPDTEYYPKTSQLVFGYHWLAFPNQVLGFTANHWNTISTTSQKLTTIGKTLMI